MTACAIDDIGVSCWGQNDRGQTAVPTLANPRMVSTGTFHSCALSDSGVSCWGSNEFGQTAVPPLVMPTNVSAGETHSCAIDENKVVCWGGAPGLVDFSDLPVVGQVTQMDRGDCALTDGVLKCWPQDKYSQVNENLQGITSISRSNGYACATGNELFKDRNGNKTTGAVKAYCTGNAEPGTTEVPAGLRNPRSIAAGASFACVIEHDDDKVVCWGKDVTNGGFKVPDDVPHR